MEKKLGISKEFQTHVLVHIQAKSLIKSALQTGINPIYLYRIAKHGYGHPNHVGKVRRDLLEWRFRSKNLDSFNKLCDQIGLFEMINIKKHVDLIEQRKQFEI